MEARSNVCNAEKADISLSSNNDDDGALQDVRLTLGNDQRAVLAPSFAFLTRRIVAQSWLFFPEQEGVVEKHNMELVLEGGREVPSPR
jgi:hypothetical protein